MKFENLMLHGLFLACFAVSALILAAMLTATPPPDGVLCPHRPG